MNEQEAAEKKKKFAEVAYPLIKWVKNNCHPHTTVIVDSESAEVLSGEMAITTSEERITQ